MSENGRFLKGLEDRPHHVTIPLEEWRPITRERCNHLKDRFGVSIDQLVRQLRSGDTENRTFRIKHLVPLYLSVEEILHAKSLSRIAKERNLDYMMLKSARRHAKDRRKARCSAVGSVPDAPPLDIRDALVQVLSTRTTPSFGVHLLVSVQNEDAEEQRVPLPITCVAMHAQLERFPLPVLHRLISDLHQVREAWKRDLLTPSAAVAVQQQMVLGREAINALLYHVCLWQRRYPLELVSAVLSFYDENRHLFPSTATRFTPAQLESLLEEVHLLYYPDLSDVPGLIRCDVFMTYPHMPLEEQRQLMRKIAATVAHRQATRDLQRQSTGVSSEEEDALDNFVKHSRTPFDPRLLLSFMADDGPAAIPERFCTTMSTEQYHAMRAGFEHHKHDGVRRLALQDYGKGGEGEGAANPKPLPPHHPVHITCISPPP
ncbi:hypothetical protein JKF63_07669 [Porcisia hertigi]|uniref:Uncharacterized protein n=1 Tax=Porcisia hertigi TaxID=2761500 RepID=A0A836IZA7_9TRYP|nr:hypothetical protein JKF63_07669 [Porcisia hertigi]